MKFNNFTPDLPDLDSEEMKKYVREWMNARLDRVVETSLRQYEEHELPEEISSRHTTVLRDIRECFATLHGMLLILMPKGDSTVVDVLADLEGLFVRLLTVPQAPERATAEQVREAIAAWLCTKL